MIKSIEVAAGVRVLGAEDVRGDLDQERLQLAAVPFVERLGQLDVAQAAHAAHQIVGLGDQLHVAVFDAVVHHLHVVAGAARADVRDARAVFDLRGDLGQDRRHVVVARALAARHQRRAVARAFLAARHAHAEEADARGAQLRGAPLGVAEVLVAAVDQHVAFAEQRPQRRDGLVDDLARLDQHDEAAWPAQHGQQIGQRLERVHASGGGLRREALDRIRPRVPPADREAVVRDVERQVLSHDAEADDADIQLFQE